MATIYKPTYTRKDPGTGKTVTKKYGKHYIKFKDASGRTRQVPGYKDLGATRQLAAELERKVELEKCGITNPFEGQQQRPLTEHLEDFGQFLRGREVTADYVRDTVNQVRAVLDGTDARLIRDLSPPAITEFLSRAREAGTSIETANHYVRAVKSFSRWLVKDHRTDRDLLIYLERIDNPERDRRRVRRTLSQGEFSALMAAARESTECFRGLSGAERGMLYLVAANTGLRSSELARLTPDSFRLAGKPPTVTVAAGYSKRRRQDVLPLREDLALLLKEWLATRPSEGAVWPGTWNERSAKMLRIDLAAARAKWLDSAADETEREQREKSDFLKDTDRHGHVFDFHALRHQFITELVRSGVHPKVAQSLARHSTITLTMDRYSHLGLIDMNAGLAALPPLPGQEEERKASSAG